MASAVTEGCPAERRKKRGRKWRQSDLPSGFPDPSCKCLIWPETSGNFGAASVLVGRSVPKADLSCLGNHRRDND